MEARVEEREEPLHPGSPFRGNLTHFVPLCNPHCTFLPTTCSCNASLGMCTARGAHHKIPAMGRFQARAWKVEAPIRGATCVARGHPGRQLAEPGPIGGSARPLRGARVRSLGAFRDQVDALICPSPASRARRNWDRGGGGRLRRVDPAPGAGSGDSGAGHCALLRQRHGRSARRAPDQRCRRRTQADGPARRIRLAAGRALATGARFGRAGRRPGGALAGRTGRALPRTLAAAADGRADGVPGTRPPGRRRRSLLRLGRWLSEGDDERGTGDRHHRPGQGAPVPRPAERRPGTHHHHGRRQPGDRAR